MVPTLSDGVFRDGVARHLMVCSGLVVTPPFSFRSEAQAPPLTPPLVASGETEGQQHAAALRPHHVRGSTWCLRRRRFRESEQMGLPVGTKKKNRKVHNILILN